MRTFWITYRLSGLTKVEPFRAINGTAAIAGILARLSVRARTAFKFIKCEMR